MRKDLCNLGLSLLVAEFALFSTDFVGVETAMAWIYEAEEGTDEQGKETVMRHPFIASLPATEET